MKNKKWPERIKKVIKERDGSFYLMIFVVFFTFLTIFLWAANFKTSLAENKKNNQKVIQIDETKKEDLNKSIDNLMIALDNLDKINNTTTIEVNTSSTSTDDLSVEISKNELEEVKQKLNDKINELNTTSSSSIPILSQELDDSEQEINELKLKIAELEEKLNEK